MPAESENNNAWWLTDLWSVPALGAEHDIMQSVWERSAYRSVCMAPTLHIKNISAPPNTSPVLKMTQSALLFTAGTVPQTAASGTIASQTQKPRRIALCYSIPGLSRSFFSQFFFTSSRWTYQCVYTDGEETEGSLSGRLIFIILRRKKKKGDAYLQLSQWTNKIPQLPDEG